MSLYKLVEQRFEKKSIKSTLFHGLAYVNWEKLPGAVDTGNPLASNTNERKSKLIKFL